jgi:monoamine oxidase
MAPTRIDDILDVAIVGGGVSGLYSGWRLLTSAEQTGKRLNTAIFEGSPRLGGRLLSVVPPGIPNARVELGGMRYTSAHTRVAGLVAHLGLKADDFPVGQPENIAYVRGTMLRRKELTDPSLIPYRFTLEETDPATLSDGFTAVAARRALRIMLGKDVPLNEVDWQKLASDGRYNGTALANLPMQYVIQRSISEEAFRFAEDTGGYDSILHTWNAADGLPWNLADFGEPVSFHHLHDGFETLPLALADFYRKSGGAVRVNSRLKSFDQVTLADGTQGVEMHIVAGGATQRILARRLILAMPRRSLELLDQTGAVLGPGNDRVHALIRSVTPIPLFKLALCYSYPWWETLPAVAVPSVDGKSQMVRITKGQSITDLPVRQCYYWAVDETSKNAVMLIYDDGSDLDYWAGLRSRDRNEPYVAADAAAPIPHTPLPSWDEHTAPKLMVDEAHRQLLVMHGLSGRADIPAPYAAAYRDWGEDPFGGGANFWHLHVDSAKIFTEILQPKPPVPVYICGEAYSHDQGWVEGPLATADAMLERHFELKSPAWLQGNH